MFSAGFLAPVLCFVADRVSAGRCYVSAQGDATFLAAPTCTPSCSCSPLPTMPKPHSQQKDCLSLGIFPSLGCSHASDIALTLNLCLTNTGNAG